MDANQYQLVKHALAEGTYEDAIVMRLTMLNSTTGKRRDEACRLAEAYWQAVFDPKSAKASLKAYDDEKKAQRAAEKAAKELAENSASEEA